MPTLSPIATKLGNTRVTGKEQYYTPIETARELISQVEKVLGSLAGKAILEPAGGTGSFVDAALAAGAGRVISFDIEPLHPLVQPGSFLDVEISESELITISNPPFGRNNALSIPFFNKAASHSDAICFIVPRSWRKWSVTNRLSLDFELVADSDLDIDYVNSKGKLISNKTRLATCFQIWQRTKIPRKPIRIRDMGLVEKVSPSEADVSMTVFGYGCGKVRTDFEPIANTTQLFLRLIHKDALGALQQIDFSKFYKNTAYTEALSLQEINYLLNEKLLGDPMIESDE